MVVSGSLGVIFSAFQAPRWLGWLALILLGAAALAFLATLPWVARLFPFELVKKDPKGRAAIQTVVQRAVLRRTLQGHLGALNDLKDPSAPELRGFSHSVMETLEDAGHFQSALQVDVQLNDDASPEAVKKRKEEIHLSLMRMLIWDEFV